MKQMIYAKKILISHKHLLCQDAYKKLKSEKYFKKVLLGIGT